MHFHRMDYNGLLGSTNSSFKYDILPLSDFIPRCLLQRSTQGGEPPETVTGCALVRADAAQQCVSPSWQSFWLQINSLVKLEAGREQFS